MRWFRSRAHMAFMAAPCVFVFMRLVMRPLPMGGRPLMEVPLMAGFSAGRNHRLNGVGKWVACHATTRACKYGEHRVFATARAAEQATYVDGMTAEGVHAPDDVAAAVREGREVPSARWDSAVEGMEAGYAAAMESDASSNAPLRKVRRAIGAVAGRARRSTRGAFRRAAAASAALLACATLAGCGQQDSYQQPEPDQPTTSQSQSAQPDAGGNGKSGLAGDELNQYGDKAKELAGKAKAKAQELNEKYNTAENRRKARDKAQELLDGALARLDSYGSSSSASSSNGATTDTASQMGHHTQASINDDLAYITVSPGGSGSGYDRSSYTPNGWNYNGQDMRAETLAKAGASRDGFVGTDAYGNTIDAPTRKDVSRKVDIDHIVPLKLVEKSGGANLTPEQKQAIAHDPENLVAVDASANRSKGDKGPSEWMPAANQCEYAGSFVHVLRKYGLTITQADKDAIQRAVMQCPAN